VKRILSLVITVLMLISATTYAAPVYSDNVAGLLSELSIMQGDPDGNMRYDDLVSRAECTKIAVAASNYRNSVATGSKTSPFSDVPSTHWASPYVTVGIQNGLVKGYLDATFRPSETVLYEEAATMFLRVLGYTDEDFGASWPDGQIGIAKNIGVLDNINKNVGETLTRRDIATMAYNTLISKAKNSQSMYLSTFNRTIVDDVVLISTIDEDSSVADGKIFTSAGTYNLSDSLDRSNIGKRGSLVLRNGDTVVSFIPDGKTTGNDKQMVYSTLGNGIITYKNGSFNQIDVNADTPIYKDSNKLSGTSALSSLKMGDVLRINYKSNGEIDYIMCSSGTTIGPKTVSSSDWYSSFGTDSSVTVMRDGLKSSVSDVKTNDIAYYIEELDIALVYSKKVTGIYESATPNKDTPLSVTVSGVTYALEGVNAFSKLSSNGVFNYGDTVTLLLGKSGDVADVLTNSSKADKIYGFLTATGTKETIISGTSVKKPYVKVILPSGEVCEFITNKDYKNSKNSVVSVTLDDGIATISTKVPDFNISGEFDWNSKKLGSNTLANDVKILEVSTTQLNETALTAKVFPQRLDGITLSKNSVLYASKNSDGYVDEIILEDITNDMHTYGILTAAKSNTATSVSGSYEYIANGEFYSVQTVNSAFSVSKGQAVKITTDGRTVSSISALSKLSSTKISAIDGTLITIGDKTYTMSDNVQIYLKNSSGYTMLTKDELLEKKDGHIASVYTDNGTSDAKRVRIIVLS